MNKLDNFTSEYKPHAKTQSENKLVLNWYPKRIINRIKNIGEKSLLELGIGHGYTTPYFNKVFAKHVVLEGSDVVITQYKENYNTKNLEIVETYFENYTTDRKFDVIIMGFILEHVDDPTFILNKYKQYLKKDGVIYITVPNAKCLNRRIGLELGKINDIYELNQNDLAMGHKRNFCRESLTQLLNNCELKINYEEGIYLKPLPLPYMQMMPELEENLNAMLKIGIDFPDLCVALLMEVTK